MKRGVDKRGRNLGALETRKAAREEHHHRLETLWEQMDVECATLATTLEGCGRDKRLCGSMACPRCARWRRITTSASILALLANYALADLRFVTLINPADAIPAGQLHTFDPKRLIDRTRRQLERVGVDKAQTFIIGTVDGEWDEGWWLYQPHIHAITWGITKAHLTALVAKWPKDPRRVRVRKRLEPIDDLPRVVAYLDKSFWPSVARAKNAMGLHPHGKRRPPPHIETEVLHWFHQQSPQHLRLMYGVKFYGRCLMKT